MDASHLIYETGYHVPICDGPDGLAILRGLAGPEITEERRNQ